MSHEELVKLVTKLADIVWPEENGDTALPANITDGVIDILTSAGLKPMDKNILHEDVPDSVLHEMFLNEFQSNNGCVIDPDYVNNPQTYSSVGYIRDFKDTDGKCVGKLIIEFNGSTYITSHVELPWMIKVTEDIWQKYMKTK